MAKQPQVIKNMRGFNTSEILANVLFTFMLNANVVCVLLREHSICLTDFCSNFRKPYRFAFSIHVLLSVPKTRNCSWFLCAVFTRRRRCSQRFVAIRKRTSTRPPDLHTFHNLLHFQMIYMCDEQCAARTTIKQGFEIAKNRWKWICAILERIAMRQSANNNRAERFVQRSEHIIAFVFANWNHGLDKSLAPRILLFLWL